MRGRNKPEVCSKSLAALFFFVLISLQTLRPAWGGAAPDDGLQASAAVTRIGACLLIDGAIGAETAKRFKAALTDNTTCVRIRSAGGTLPAAVEIGNEIYARQLDVYAFEYCWSACANYIFIAGRRKIIERGTTVAVHWSAFTLQKSTRDIILADEQRFPRSPAAEKMLPTILANLERDVQMEKKFAARIGMPYLFYSHMPDAVVYARDEDRISEAPRILFSLRGASFKGCLGLPGVFDRRTNSEYAALNAQTEAERGLIVIADGVRPFWSCRRLGS